jgi:hypothetical protein
MNTYASNKVSRFRDSTKLVWILATFVYFSEIRNEFYTSHSENLLNWVRIFPNNRLIRLGPIFFPKRIPKPWSQGLTPTHLISGTRQPTPVSNMLRTLSRTWSCAEGDCVGGVPAAAAAACEDGVGAVVVRHRRSYMQAKGGHGPSLLIENSLK